MKQNSGDFRIQRFPGVGGVSRVQHALDLLPGDLGGGSCAWSPASLHCSEWAALFSRRAKLRAPGRRGRGAVLLQSGGVPETGACLPALQGKGWSQASPRLPPTGHSGRGARTLPAPGGWSSSWDWFLGALLEAQLGAGAPLCVSAGHAHDEAGGPCCAHEGPNQQETFRLIFLFQILGTSCSSH